MGKLWCAVVLAVAIVSQSSAKEVGSTAEIASTGDWILADRNDWLLKRRSAIASMIPGPGIPGIRFLNAFAFNVKNDRPNDYTTVGQRHAFYDALSYALHFAADVPQELRCVRFFDAAADVTATYSVGAVELWKIIKDAAGLTPDTENLLIKTNAELFARNFKVIQKLMLTWRQPRDPSAAAPTERLDALDFDLKMVAFEQGTVETFLAANSALVTVNVRNDLKAAHPGFDFAGQFLTGQGGNVARRKLFRETWLPAVGIANFDFFKKTDRVAMGEAYVFFLHGYDLNKYKTYKIQGTKPAASCKGVLPGLASLNRLAFGSLYSN
ncbi:hypothetical protein GGD65_005403 [Bradyrhizobium sp. CIR18]|uniref:hypothetical protein n=1 Tax=Bradyrhizobium sp. CIR18 TaxID=2663839 RepID=UPI001606DCBA|nr:hypothetical protein [Bradyrhizobium sp. CIR18]MBB4364345.1 hypothetical protein [Bradyrhizobium sp. CIR18]